jgi:hypothetical protein
MSNGTTQNAKFGFRPWVRRGVATVAGQPDGPSPPDRVALDVTLSVQAEGGSAAPPQTPQMTVHVYGPGDVIGIDPRHVIRTEPRDSTMNFEPNYLAGIEFDYPDLPWLFTPALPNGDRLRPFIALIVLKASEYTTADVPPNPLPAIDVQSMTALQPLDDAWNWGHAQVSGDGDLTTTISSNPAAVISRLLCPRRLDPETGYTAFLVPAFEIGRQAGLGMDVSGLHTSDPAWTSQTSAPLRLPVYYQFSFNTSDAGDFESLVRALNPMVLPPDVGSAPMDVSQPGAGIPSAGAPLGLEGALRSVSATTTPWSGPDHDAFQAAVAALVNLTAAAGPDDPDHPAAQDPHIVPPFYGKWQAAASAVTPGQPGWLNDLNLDPRNRTAAGMGTQIVQGQRAALMASAWDQVAGIEAANQQLRAAQLSRGAMTAIWTTRLTPASSATLLSLTAPVQARILASPQTVYATIATSRVPQRVVSAAYRRVARPLGPLALRAASLSGVTVLTPLLTRINDDAVRISPPAPPPGNMTSLDQVSDATESAATTSSLPGWVPGWLRAILLWLVEHLPSWLDWLLTLLGLGPLVQAVTVSTTMRTGSLTEATVAAAPPASTFTVTTPPSGLGGDGTLQVGSEVGPPVTSPSPGDSPSGALFRTAAGALLTALHTLPADPPLAPALDLATLSSTVLSRLNPAVTVAARMSGIVHQAGGPWLPADPLEPIMAAPTFTQPMYAPLRDLNQNYLLPGTGLIPPDTLGAVVANHAFIESYMTGLNHEMARQLLWNGYPTDQRGTYFRQFWDVSGYVPQPGDPTNPAQLAELLKDIPPINTWPLSQALGLNENRTDVVADNVVLLIRGELLRRYPNTVIFAGRAMAGTGGDDGRVLDDTDQRFPIFRGTLSPDITFLGFNLSVDDARGGTAAAPLGYFFVFQQQPTEPRFGLEPQSSDPVTQWEDLAWTNFAATSQSDGAGAVAPRAGFGVGQGTLTESAVSSVFPALPPTEISRYRVASTVFAGVLASYTLPAFLSASQSPSGVTLSGANPEDSALAWGVNAAQTAAITIRMPFRIMVHADALLPAAAVTSEPAPVASEPAPVASEVAPS